VFRKTGRAVVAKALGQAVRCLQLLILFLAVLLCRSAAAQTYEYQGCNVTAENATESRPDGELTLTFTQNGTLTIPCSAKADILVVGGGGSGAAGRKGSKSWYGGAGGNGGNGSVGSHEMPQGTYAIVVGAGGKSVTNSSSSRGGSDVQAGNAGSSSSIELTTGGGTFAKVTGTGGSGGSTKNTSSSSGSSGNCPQTDIAGGSAKKYGNGGAGCICNNKSAAVVGAAGGAGTGDGGGGGAQGGSSGAGGCGVVIVRIKEIYPPIEKPVAATGLTYDGTERTGVSAGEHYTLGGTYRAKNAGSYVATVTPANGYCWSDGTYDAVSLTWTIARRPVTVSVVATNKLVGAVEPVYPTTAVGFVDGDDVEATWKVWRTNLVEQADGTMALDEAVGAYDLLVAGTEQTTNYEIAYVNGSRAFEIRKPAVEVAVPTAAQGLVYDGLVKTGVVAGEGYDLTGTPTATDAGDYAATATLKSGYVWVGGATDARTIFWSIAKADYEMSGVTFANRSTTYNGKVQPMAVAGTLPDGVTVAYENNGNKDAGNYTVTAKFTGDTKNHNTIADKTAELAIEPALATVTADAKTKTYGAADPELTATVTGTFGGDTVAYTLSRTVGEDVGDYAITPSGSKLQGNYDVAFAAGTLTIGKATPTPAAADGLTLTLTYGETLGERTASVVGTMTANGKAVAGTFAFAAPETRPTVEGGEAQPFAATFTPTDDAKYHAADVMVQVTVNRKELTVSARDFTIVYGDGAPTYVTNAVTGFAAGDDAGVISGVAAFACDYEQGMGTNVYGIAIDVTGLAADNYSFAGEDGKLTVNPKPVTVTPTAGQSKTQGEAYVIAYTSDPETLVGTDAFTGTLTVADEVGAQPITQGTLGIDDGNGGANYELTVVAGVTIEIKAAGPSMPADDGTIDYDPTTKEVVVKPDEGVKDVEISGMPSDATAAVPVTVDTVKGVTSNQVVVVAEATNVTGTVRVDITDAFTITETPTGVTIALNEDPAAEVEVEIAGKTETIKVTPELTDAGDGSLVPLAVDEGSVGLGAKTIPGLTYHLKRSATPGDVPEEVASETAKGTRTRLTDPMEGGKPAQAFYVIEVTK